MNEELQQLYERFKKCTVCPPSAWPIGTIEVGWGTPGKIMFIGQNPALSSLGKEPGSSSFDKYFFSILDEAGISKDDFFFTNIYKAPPKQRPDEIFETVLYHAGDHIREEIERVKPILIVALGMVSGKWLANQRFENKMIVHHPSAARYGKPTRSQYIAELKSVKLRYEKIKVEKKEKRHE